MNIGFTLTDIQDLFLYGYLLDMYVDRGHSVFVYYDKASRKRTSIKANKGILNNLKGCQVVPYIKREDCISRAKHDKIDIIMTNEGMPFRLNSSLPCKMYAFGWTIEFAVHGPRFLPICDTFFVDDPIAKVVHDFSKYKNIKIDYDNHPKYLFLNEGRNKVCKMLGLNPSNKYITVLGPAPLLDYKAKKKDISKTVDVFRSGGYKIIYKYKPKDNNINICKYDKKISHLLVKHSTSTALSFVSEAVVGFNTSGIIESVHTNTPFINFFLEHSKVNYKKHWQFMINSSNILRIEKYHEKKILDFIGKKTEKRKKYLLSGDLDL